MDVSTRNSQVALVRVEQGPWATSQGFFDILADVSDEHVDAIVAEVHGDAKYGNQGEAR